jgi:hypothetical protein
VAKVSRRFTVNLLSSHVTGDDLRRIASTDGGRGGSIQPGQRKNGPRCGMLPARKIFAEARE